MIIMKYLINMVIKSQITIFLILIVVFFSQKTLNILSLVIQGTIPSKLILSLIYFSIPEIIQLILPLTLFLGLLITYSNLYLDKEIIVMYACGIGKKILVITALILALCVALLEIININWLLPLSSIYQSQTLANMKANPNIIDITAEGQFKKTEDHKYIFYINKIKKNNFTDIFIAHLDTNNKYPSILIANNGYSFNDKYGNQIIILNKGILYEPISLLQSFRIITYKNYKLILPYKKINIIADNVKQKNMLNLWYANDNKSKAEFHWRLTLIIIIFIMTIIVIPLSKVNSRKQKLLNILITVLLYSLFILLQTILYSNIKKNEGNYIFIVWLLNIFFMLLAIILNILDMNILRWLRIKLCNRLT